MLEIALPKFEASWEPAAQEAGVLNLRIRDVDEIESASKVERAQYADLGIRIWKFSADLSSQIQFLLSDPEIQI